jgi:hypothetical protein
MTQAQHTPAQWHAHRAFYRDGGYVCQSHSDCGKAPFEVWGETREEAQANARLIAAAPELLEALEALMRNFVGDRSAANTSGEAGLAADAARAAIAKARGEVA